jgi:hypothetical protein
MRIACALDPASLRELAALCAQSDAQLELVSADGRRARIARGAAEADLRMLFAAVAPGSGAWIELRTGRLRKRPAGPAASWSKEPYPFSPY